MNRLCFLLLLQFLDMPPDMHQPFLPIQILVTISKIQKYKNRKVKASGFKGHKAPINQTRSILTRQPLTDSSSFRILARYNKLQPSRTASGMKHSGPNIHALHSFRSYFHHLSLQRIRMRPQSFQPHTLLTPLPIYLYNFLSNLSIFSNFSRKSYFPLSIL